MAWCDASKWPIGDGCKSLKRTNQDIDIYEAASDRRDLPPKESSQKEAALLRSTQNTIVVLRSLQAYLLDCERGNLGDRHDSQSNVSRTLDVVISRSKVQALHKVR